MNFRSILVTGGAGFIGANFAHYWLRQYPACKIFVLDALTYAANVQSFGNLQDSPSFHFIKGDIRDTALVEDILRRHEIEAIVHFAAESHVDRSISGPDAFIDTNILGTHSLLKAARTLWLDEKLSGVSRRFLHVSTDEVYGSLSGQDAPFTESSQYAPNSPYSASKAASDHLVRAYHHTYGLPTVTTNCSNNYGPYQYPEKLLPLTLINCLEGKPLPVYGDGSNVRDWLFVEDHCRGIDLALHRGSLGECYNLGGNSEMANIDLVKLLCAEIDARFAADPSLGIRFPDAPASSGTPSAELITFVGDRPGHDKRYAIDPSYARQELEFIPAETLQSGLKRTIDWYLENEDWWQGIRDGSYRAWLAKNYDDRSSL